MTQTDSEWLLIRADVIERINHAQSKSEAARMRAIADTLDRLTAALQTIVDGRLLGYHEAKEIAHRALAAKDEGNAP